jgi:RNA polymerase sigma-70 factor (ECF subfamily)
MSLIAPRTPRTPTHRGHRRRTVGALRAAASDRDLRRLRELLAPDVAVVVDAGRPDRAKVRVVRGPEDASLLLVHALSAREGLEVAERPVNDRPGLVVSRGGRPTAAIAVDLTDRLVSVVWVRLDPAPLRRGMAV